MRLGASRTAHQTAPIEISATLSEITGICFPGPGQIRSRKIISRSNVRSAGKYPSWKMKRMLHWESGDELNAFRLLDCNPEITNYSEQPCRVVYVSGGVERVHYPDLLVTTAEEKELWEVKPRPKALDPEVLARTTFLARALPSWGYAYKVVFAEDLAIQPRLTNANLLLRFGTKDVDGQEWEQVRRIVGQRGRLIWSEACNGDYGTRGCGILCGLVLRGVLTIDMNFPISATTQFHTTSRL